MPVPLDDLIARMKPMATNLNMPEPWVRLMAEVTRVVRMDAGQLFQVEGEPAGALYVVLSGRVKIFRTAANGREQVIHVAGAGDHVNLVPLIDGGSAPASLQALTEANLLSCGAAAFRDLLDREPRLALIMMKDLARRQRQLVHLVDELALHTVQTRLIRLLIERAEAAERGNDVVPLTQTEMASQIGTVREMVARTLRTLDGLGLIRMDGGRITVLDRAGLASRAEPQGAA